MSTRFIYQAMAQRTTRDDAPASAIARGVLCAFALPEGEPAHHVGLSLNTLRRT